MKRFLALWIAAASLLNGQEFSEYRLRYDQFEQNDARALPHIRTYILEAKKADNDRELFQAYKDAVHFFPGHKLAYADSAVWAATRTGDRGLIATSYITKGTVYYFNYRKFQPALDEYLKAWEFSKDSPNDYLHYKNLYHIGVVKNYLGHYQEAFEIFEKCRTYFNHPADLPEPANAAFNRKKGYLNALHQSAGCLIELGRLDEGQHLIDEGLRESGAQADFYLERSFFLKLKGMMACRRGQPAVAVAALKTALLGFEKKDDFTNASVIYYYIGKSRVMMGDDAGAVQQFARVDSVFTKYAFLLPEVRGSYEFLIDWHQKKQDSEREHYYTLQLLKADRLISTDFKYLFPKIIREYDTQDLLASKIRLEHSVSRLYTVLWTATVFFTVTGIVLLYPKQRRTWLYQRFRKKKTVDQGGLARSEPGKRADPAHKVSDTITEAVLEKLKVLESRHFFLETGMTLHKLAPLLNTNAHYLGIIIKEHRGCPYTIYMKELRIHYVAKMLRENKKWRSMKIENLANACGFKDRSNFNEAFAEYYHLRPLEYIERVRREKTEEHPQ